MVVPGEVCSVAAASLLSLCWDFALGICMWMPFASSGINSSKVTMAPRRLPLTHW